MVKQEVISTSEMVSYYCGVSKVTLNSLIKNYEDELNSQ